MTPTRFDISIGRQDPSTACDAWALQSGLSEARIKQAMIKGAVQAKRQKAHVRRIRRATAAVRPGDRLVFCYDPAILQVKPPHSRLIRDFEHCSVWFKPAGLMTQGTRFGDHCALSRQVERHFRLKREVFLVHRIDREAAGLVIVTHSRHCASRFSKLFRKRAIEKQYMVWVRGDLSIYQPYGHIHLALDGKSADTRYEMLRYESEKNQTLARVRIHTGRCHQIRCHFAMIGYPVMGDPRYGQGNKNQEGLQLVAYSLAFQCPYGRGRIKVEIDPEALGLV